jgi:SAM-dependent methyltransferase
MMISGTRETQRFYNEVGWKEKDGASVNNKLFGVKEDGPIRLELHRLHYDRIRSALSRAGTHLSLLECGCGGNPEKKLLSLCSRFTGVDFSDTGIQMAKSSFADVAIPSHFQTADVCALPFKDGEFDAVYCAHMIYHIEDPAAQDVAISELMRVVRPGGTVVLVVANPRPWAFPLRFLRRMVADMPLVGSLLNRVRPKPPLPYKPMPLGWMRRRLARGGSVDIVGAGIPSTAFFQNVTEYRGFGKLLWKVIRWTDFTFPKLSAYLGNYATMTCTRSMSVQKASRG